MSVKAKYDPLLFKFPKGVISKNKTVRFHVEYIDEKEPKNVYLLLDIPIQRYCKIFNARCLFVT